MVPQQVFNASLLGLVLGTLAIRSQSLVPCIAFHFINNALGVIHGRFGDRLLKMPGLKDLVAIDGDGALRYQWPTLAVSLIVAVPLLVWLFRPLYQHPRTDDASGGAAAFASEQSGPAMRPIV